MTNIEKQSIKEMMHGMSDEDLQERLIWIDEKYLFAEIRRRYDLMKNKLISVGAVLGGE